jgi:TonB family protein
VSPEQGVNSRSPGNIDKFVINNKVSEEKGHIKFTAADIEKYHTGQLSAREMHAMEKAALDDPFLADALEGYTVTGVNAAIDTAELKKRLAARLQGGKVITMDVGRRSGFPRVKAAAMIVMIAGAGFLVYLLAFNKRSGNNIAQTQPKAKEEIKTADTNRTAAITKENTITTNDISQKETVQKVNKQAAPVTVTKESSSGAGMVADSILPGTATINAKPLTPPGQERNFSTFSEKQEIKKDNAVVKQDYKAKAVTTKPDSDGDGVMDKPGKKQTEENTQGNGYATLNKRAQIQQQANFFRGRVTDPNNNPVPFANVTNTQDNVGTYTDAKGNFNLISPDSVLNVQVRSIGFENNNAQLRNNLTGNQVVMQEDKSLDEVVISNKKPNANRSRDNNLKLEEPEPADGWDDYDVYLNNNLKVPDEFKSKRTGGGEVEISFEVDKNGEPANIKIVKSLCGKCDSEAIRLIKEGPKWKRKAKKGRTTVTIPF